MDPGTQIAASASSLIEQVRVSLARTAWTEGRRAWFLRRNSRNKRMGAGQARNIFSLKGSSCNCKDVPQVKSYTLGCSHMQDRIANWQPLDQIYPELWLAIAVLKL